MKLRSTLMQCLWLGASLLCAGGLLVGGRALMLYEGTPGMQATAPETWPPDSPIRRPQDRYLLVMLAHPNCPCTRASLDEMAQLMAQLDGKVAGAVIFSKPESQAADVRSSDLWSAAARIPKVSAYFDHDGSLTRNLGGHVSGQVELYDLRGHLAFSGGITAIRGHAGDNPGVDAVRDLVLHGPSPHVVHTPVFGCSLHNPNSELSKDGLSWKK